MRLAPAMIVLGLLLLLLIPLGCTTPCDPNDEDCLQPTHAATTRLAGFQITVELYRDAGHQVDFFKIVQIYRDGRLIARRRYEAPGGYTSCFVLTLGSRLVLLDHARRGMVVDRDTGAVSDQMPEDLPEGYVRECVGRFMLVQDGGLELKWVPTASLLGRSGRALASVTPSDLEPSPKGQFPGK